MNWLTNLLEEEMYKFYLKEYPAMVDGIKKLLIAGEPKSKIKKYCEATVGKCQTSRTISFMIDYVNAQIKN